MNESTRRELLASAEEQTRGFSPDVEGSVADGAGRYRTRLHRIYAGTAAVFVVLAAGLVLAHPAIGELIPRDRGTIVLAPDAPTVIVGETLTMQATIEDSDGSIQPVGEDVEWASSNWTVATVADGVVTALAVGTTEITAQTSGASGTTTVTVAPAAALTGIALDPAALNLEAGQDAAITATGTYEDGETADLTASATWASSDAAVATVDAAGRVSAIASGTALISATSDGVNGSATVTVGDVELIDVRIDPGQSQLRAGDTQQLTVVGEFSDGSSEPLQDPVTWTSSDAKSVQVDATGLVTAVTASTSSLITASVRGFSPTATVEVLPSSSSSSP